MKKSLHIQMETLDKGPVQLTGTLPGRFLDLKDEPSIRNIGDISYTLTVEKTGHEILAMGSLEVPMELECVRSGLFFSTIVSESAFLRDYSTEDLREGVDLSEDIREALVIRIPAYPVSPEAQSPDFELPKLPSKLTDDSENNAGNSPWNDLDQLNL
jgi:uncharacterized metal-binding protein YceD (DUF177 family)